MCLTEWASLGNEKQDGISNHFEAIQTSKCWSDLCRVLKTPYQNIFKVCNTVKTLKKIPTRQKFQTKILIMLKIGDWESDCSLPQSIPCQLKMHYSDKDRITSVSRLAKGNIVKTWSSATHYRCSLFLNILDCWKYNHVKIVVWSHR